MPHHDLLSVGGLQPDGGVEAVQHVVEEDEEAQLDNLALAEVRPHLSEQVVGDGLRAGDHALDELERDTLPVGELAAFRRSDPRDIGFGQALLLGLSKTNAASMNAVRQLGRFEPQQLSKGCVELPVSP